MPTVESSDRLPSPAVQLDISASSAVPPAPPTPQSSSSPPPSPPLVRAVAAEFLSTFAYVHLSLQALASSPSPLATAITSAATLAALIASFASLAAAHVNPAVTLALALTRHINTRTLLLFLPAQLAASTAATLLAAALGTPVPPPPVFADAPLATSFMREALPMAVVVAVVYLTVLLPAATHRTADTAVAPLYVGLAMAVSVAAFPESVFNPARAFGPAVFTVSFSRHWLLWLGPFTGATIAALLCEHAFLAPAEKRRPNSVIAVVLSRSKSLQKELLDTLAVVSIQKPPATAPAVILP